MKHLTALFITGLFFMGIVACEKVGKEGETKETSTEEKKAEGHEHDSKGSTHALTSVTWDQTMHDFGKVPDTDSITHKFTFTNTGSNPLFIEEVKPACGCTKGNYSKDAIAPGAQGFVELKFGPQGKEGIQTKNATVILNTDPKTHQLTFKADVSKSK